MEYKSLRQFRADLKTAFDYVESGAEEGDLTIERDGTIFKLVLESWKAPEEPEETNIVKYHEKKIATEISNFKEKKLKGSFNEVCKNGHLLGRFGKCLEKGCKYS